MPRLAALFRERSALGDLEGPNIVIILFVSSLVIGVLVGVGASSFGHHDAGGTVQRTHHAQAVSRAAAELGYTTERDFEADNARAESATLQVLQSPPGTQRLWENAESGNRGVVWSGDETASQNGSICRDLVRRTLINNAFRNASATACHQQGESWSADADWRNE
jgi:surface antigen